MKTKTFFAVLALVAAACTPKAGKTTKVMNLSYRPYHVSGRFRRDPVGAGLNTWYYILDIPNKCLHKYLLLYKQVEIVIFYLLFLMKLLTF